MNNNVNENDFNQNENAAAVNTVNADNTENFDNKDKKALRKKKRKKFFKTLFKIVGIGFAAVLVLLLVLFIATHKIIFGFFDNFKRNGIAMDYTPQYSEVHMTNEQMMSDFEYYYDIACTNSFVTEQAERYLGFDYSKLHDEYAERVRNCKDEFEFFAIMVSLSAKVPGAHNAFYAPSDNLSSNSTFPLSEQLYDEEVMDVNYSYWTQFKDRMYSYDQKRMYLTYYGGDYLTVYDGLNEDALIPGFKNAKLLTLNGENIDKAIFKLDTIHKFKYDASQEKPYVTELLFNDSEGVKYVAEFMLPDGSIVTTDLYNSYEYNAASYYRDRVYKDDSESESEEEPEETIESETESEEAVENETQRCYTIQKNPEKNLVILSIFSCVSEDKNAVITDMNDAFKETDATTVIVDNRNNKGGNYSFVTEGVCPVLFTGEFEFNGHMEVPVNDLSDTLYSNKFYSVLFEKGVKKDSEKYSYYEDFSFKGQALKNYDIYLLNNHSTFSSGDILSGIFAKQPNVTIIGTNTSGEGFSGHPMTYYLPDSKFPFTVSCSISKEFPDNNYLGTVPDIYFDNDWECYKKRSELRATPEYADTYADFEGRMLWDDTMIEVVNMIDLKSGQ